MHVEILRGRYLESEKLGCKFLPKPVPLGLIPMHNLMSYIALKSSFPEVSMVLVQGHTGHMQANHIMHAMTETGESR